MRKEWKDKIGRGVSRAVIRTDSETMEEVRFPSLKAAAIATAYRPDGAGNISKAVKHGKLCYGFYWRKG